MKKILLLFSVVLVLIVLFGADIRRQKESAPNAATLGKECYGYTIIEFGKGINCQGDTIKLTRVQGAGQILASETSY